MINSLLSKFFNHFLHCPYMVLGIPEFLIIGKINADDWRDKHVNRAVKSVVYELK